MKLTKTQRQSLLSDYGLKYCPSCDRILPTENFAINRYTKSGFASSCRACVNARQRTGQGRRRFPQQFYDILAEMGMKYCPRCQRVLEAGAFHADAYKSNGLHAYCRECTHL